MMDAQAQDRAHRIGQKNEVRVFRLITNSPMEEKILARATDKRNLNGLVVEAGKFNRHGAAADRKEMMATLLKEWSEVPEAEEEGEDIEIPNDEMINEMMAILDSEVELYKQMDRQRDDRRLRLWIQHHTSQGCPPESIPPLPGRLMEVGDVPAWLKDPAVWYSKHVLLLKMVENPNVQITADMIGSGAAEAEGSGDESDGTSDKVQPSHTMSMKPQSQTNKQAHEQQQQGGKGISNASSRNQRKRKAGEDGYTNLTDAEFNSLMRNGGESGKRPSTNSSITVSQAQKAVSSATNSSAAAAAPAVKNPSQSVAKPTVSGPSTAKPGSNQPPAKPAPAPPAAKTAAAPLPTKSLSSAATSRPTTTSSAPPPTSSTISPEIVKDLLKILQDVLKVTAPEGHLLATLFRQIPDKKLFPDYYSWIEKPISLKEINASLRKGSYTSLADFEQDLMLMCSNAHKYNEDGSIVYRDSELLREEIYRRANAMRSKWGKVVGLSMSPPPAIGIQREVEMMQEEEPDLYSSKEYVLADMVEPAPAAPSTTIDSALRDDFTFDEEDLDIGFEDGEYDDILSRFKQSSSSAPTPPAKREKLPPMKPTQAERANTEGPKRRGRKRKDNSDSTL